MLRCLGDEKIVENLHHPTLGFVRVGLEDPVHDSRGGFQSHQRGLGTKQEACSRRGSSESRRYQSWGIGYLGIAGDALSTLNLNTCRRGEPAWYKCGP